MIVSANDSFDQFTKRISERHHFLRRTAHPLQIDGRRLHIDISSNQFGKVVEILYSKSLIFPFIGSTIRFDMQEGGIPVRHHHGRLKWIRFHRRYGSSMWRPVLSAPADHPILHTVQGDFQHTRCICRPDGVSLLKRKSGRFPRTERVPADQIIRHHSTQPCICAHCGGGRQFLLKQTVFCSPPAGACDIEPAPKAVNRHCKYNHSNNNTGCWNTFLLSRHFTTMPYPIIFISVENIFCIFIRLYLGLWSAVCTKNNSCSVLFLKGTNGTFITYCFHPIICNLLLFSLLTKNSVFPASSPINHLYHDWTAFLLHRVGVLFMLEPSDFLAHQNHCGGSTGKYE